MSTLLLLHCSTTSELCFKASKHSAFALGRLKVWKCALSRVQGPRLQRDSSVWIRSVTGHFTFGRLPLGSNIRPLPGPNTCHSHAASTPYQWLGRLRCPLHRSRLFQGRGLHFEARCCQMFLRRSRPTPVDHATPRWPEAPKVHRPAGTATEGHRPRCCSCGIGCICA